MKRFLEKTLDIPDRSDFIGFAIIGTFTLIFFMIEMVAKLFAFVFRRLINKH